MKPGPGLGGSGEIGFGTGWGHAIAGSTRNGGGWNGTQGITTSLIGVR